MPEIKLHVQKPLSVDADVQEFYDRWCSNQAKMMEGSLLSTEEAVLDDETTRALKALGYLQ